MNNYVQKGNYVTVTAPYNVTSGLGVLSGRIFGVSVYTALSGASIEILTTGVFDLAKDTSTFSEGDRVFWDNTNLVATSTQGANREIGVASLVNASGTNAAGGSSGDATVRVRLHGFPGLANDMRFAHFIYNFGVDGGAVGAITPTISDTIPANAVVLPAIAAINSPTAVTSGGAATVSVGTTAGSSATAILAATGKASFTADAVMAGAATPFKMTAAGQINITVGTAALTAGVIEGWVPYFVANEA